MSKLQIALQAAGTQGIFHIEHTSGFSDLEFLKDYMELKEIHIEDCPTLKNIDQLKFLRYLTKIHIIRCINIEKFSETLLQTVTDTIQLDISGCRLHDITFLTKMTHLLDLTLSDNEINDLTPINQLKEIVTLNVSQNKLKDESLKQLSNKSVQTLDLSFNQISDISFLKNMPQIRQISLHYNKLFESEQLRNLRFLIDLQFLRCDHNEFIENYDYYDILCESVPRSIDICIAGVQCNKQDFAETPITGI